MISLVLAILSAQPGFYSPQEANALFEQAGAAYYREDYAQAQEGYQKLLDHGFGGPDVLYNLGTTELAKGDLGPAILHLERARRQAADPGDIEANLALAHGKQLDKVVGAQLEESLAARISDAFSAHALGVLFLGGWVLGFLALIARRYLPGARRLVGLAALVGFLVAIPSAGLLALQAWSAQNDVEAVVLAKSLPARAFPEASAKVAFEVHEGLMVRVLDSAGGFVHIQLANGRDGWVEKDSVERI